MEKSPEEQDAFKYWMESMYENYHKIVQKRWYQAEKQPLAEYMEPKETVFDRLREAIKKDVELGNYE